MLHAADSHVSQLLFPCLVFRSHHSSLPQILEQQLQQHAAASGGCDGQMAAFRQFLGSFLPAFCRASNNLLDLKVSCRNVGETHKEDSHNFNESSRGGLSGSPRTAVPHPLRCQLYPMRAFLLAIAMQAAAVDLFKLYVQPLLEGRQMQSHQLYVRIRSEVQQHVGQLRLQAKHAMQLQTDGGHSLAFAVDGNTVTGGTGHGRQGGDRSSSKGLSFELPYLSKFLLLAAYVASRNKPTTDRAVFDPTHGKRARRDAQAQDRQVEPICQLFRGEGGGFQRCAPSVPVCPHVTDRPGWLAQVEAAVEAKLRGPHSFPLERLFIVFYALYSAHNADDEDPGSRHPYMVGCRLAGGMGTRAPKQPPAVISQPLQPFWCRCSV